MNGKQQDSVQEETIVISATMGISAECQHPSSLLPEVGVRLGSQIERRAETLEDKCSKSSCDFWHPPECQSYKKPSRCRFGDKCAFMHQQVEGQPCKKPNNDDNSAVVSLKKSRATRTTCDV